MLKTKGGGGWVSTAFWTMLKETKELIGNGKSKSYFLFKPYESVALAKNGWPSVYKGVEHSKEKVSAACRGIKCSRNLGVYEF